MTHTIDRIGATASFLCAVHCAALPLILGLLPALGLEFLADHRFERIFVTLAATLAVTSLLFGFRRHRRFAAFGFLIPGILLLIAGIIVDFDQAKLVHAVLVSSGGTLVAFAHVRNLLLTRNHTHTAGCIDGNCMQGFANPR
ncbi:MAG: MerC domain-containing protein [Dokdonella sp.]